MTCCNLQGHLLEKRLVELDTESISRICLPSVYIFLYLSVIYTIVYYMFILYV